MLLDELNIDPTEFKKLFEKKFQNFCKKAPILVSYAITDSFVTIYGYNDVKESKKLFGYPFDFTKSVKENIKDIKDILVQKHYPVMVQVDTNALPLSAKERTELVEKGMTVEDALAATNVVSSHREWRIEKVIVLRDELFVRNMYQNRLFRYKMKVPVTIFLKKVRTNFTPEESWEYFTNKSVRLNEVRDTYTEYEG